MNRFKFRLNHKKDKDRTIIKWLNSLPEGKRSGEVKEVLFVHIKDNSNVPGKGRDSPEQKELASEKCSIGPNEKLDQLVDDMFNFN